MLYLQRRKNGKASNPPGFLLNNWKSRTLNLKYSLVLCRDWSDGNGGMDRRRGRKAEWRGKRCWTRKKKSVQFPTPTEHRPCLGGMKGGGEKAGEEPEALVYRTAWHSRVCDSRNKSYPCPWNWNSCLEILLLGITVTFERTVNSLVDFFISKLPEALLCMGHRETDCPVAVLQNVILCCWCCGLGP